MSNAADDLRRIDRDRCEAISKGDVAAVAAVLRDDYTHTHITGHTDDRASYLASLEGRPRATTRGDDVEVRLYGDVAVMTGTVRNHFPAPEPGGPAIDLEVHALQVWVNGDDGWKQVASASSGQIPPGVVG